jgi:hypothetical protein
MSPHLAGIARATLSNEPLSEDRAAIEFARLYGGRLRYCHDTGAWFQWDGAIWRQNGTGLAFQFARQLSRDLANSEFVSPSAMKRQDLQLAILSPPKGRGGQQETSEQAMDRRTSGGRSAIRNR